MARIEYHGSGYNDDTMTILRAPRRIIIFSCMMFVGCGSSGQLHASDTAAERATKPPTASPTSERPATQVPNVCGLLNPQQVDAVLGPGASPVTYDGTGNGYLPPPLIAKIAQHNWIHRLDPAISLYAAASCSWINRHVSIQEGVHPTLVYNLASYSSAVPEWVFLKEYAPTKPYPAGFGPVHGLGTWAVFDGPGGELAVATGQRLLTISNSTLQYGDNLKRPYIRLARQILQRLT